ncbi:MAG: DUF58 domain-containing protein [Phycisphaerae bacterium]|nr:DUF58 domain-containing protein [Phycisphaerae bacterium]
MLLGQGKRATTIDELISPGLRAALDRLDVRSARVFAGKLQGERRGKRRGSGVEFADHRPYVAGDDLRRLDWSVFARLDRFMVKIFLEDEDLAVHLVLDRTASMDAGSPPKLLGAQRLAMALGYVGLAGNNRVSVWTFDGAEVRRLGGIRGRAAAPRLGAFLLGSTADPDAPPPESGGVDSVTGRVAGARSFAAAMRVIGGGITSGPGLVLLISDFLIESGLEEGLAMLTLPAAGGGARAVAAGGGRSDLWCFEVLSPGELDPSTEAEEGSFTGDLLLIDSESGRTREVTVSRASIRRYREALAAHRARLRAAATARGAPVFEVRSDRDPDELVLGALRRAGLIV